MNTHHHPIGFFDSGVGGTSIWKEVVELLPHENTLYLADSKNAPYGKKSKEEIIQFSIKNTEFLLNQNAKIIVVACNTATTNAIEILREKYDVAFIGIEPAIKPAGLVTQTKKIGILATQGTLNSTLFETTSGKIDPEVTIIEQVGEGLVDLIENGQIDSPEMNALLETYLQPMMHQNVDALVLGCTHYPYLIPQIRLILGESIKIIDSGLAVARQTKHILQQQGLLQTQTIAKTSHQFYINKEASVLHRLLNNSQVSIEEKAF
ncbi:glutamate racemase [Pseudotenacibaculum sp. MALMAid0570]|uniref:glutamate racemase n=1 Tax=Pseudotenacibaculum sp. MALMAid0570 TaxID=3143938 RepID=UPI0032DF447D